jgi:hypothetical protein
LDRSVEGVRLLILAAIAGTWMKGGFSAVQELLSPFNVVNWIVTVTTLAPGLGALAWAEKLKAKSPVTLCCQRLWLKSSHTDLAPTAG